MGTDNITESAAHSGMYEKYRARYGRGGCTKGQLSRLVALGALTPEGTAAGRPHNPSAAHLKPGAGPQ